MKLDVEAEVVQEVKMLDVGGDDESDFSDDCQMDFDLIKDMWVRKKRKPPWVEVAYFSICAHYSHLIKIFRDPLLLKAPFLN